VRGFLKLTWVEMKLFLRDPFATVFAIAFPFIMLMLLAAVFAEGSPDDVENGMLVWRGVSGDNYYVGASVGIIVAALGLLALPVHLAAYREQGVLRRFRASSVPAGSLFGSQLIVGLVVALAGSLLMTAIATAVYDTMLPEALLGVLVALALATVCFTAIGFLLAALIPTARAAQGIGLLLFFTAWMLSGTGPPRAVLPETVRTIGGLSPLARVTIAIQDAWYGFGWNWTELGIISAIAVAAAVPALWLFRWD
jgi:ABC-2 type transport system permease protein